MSISRKGSFITFEGIDGCGKSTQAKLLLEYLNSNGTNAILVREPGGTRISEEIRQVLLNTDRRELTHRTEALLMTASRAQLTDEIIIPKLAGVQLKLIRCLIKFLCAFNSQSDQVFFRGSCPPLFQQSSLSLHSYCLKLDLA